MFSPIGFALAATSAATTALGTYNLFKFFGRKAAEKIRDRAQRNRIEAAQLTAIDYAVKVHSELQPVLPKLKELHAAFKSGDKKAAVAKAVAELKGFLDDDEPQVPTT
jgi:hypothetical protein